VEGDRKFVEGVGMILLLNFFLLWNLYKVMIILKRHGINNRKKTIFEIKLLLRLLDQSEMMGSLQILS
jgi:hypothetical protein